MGVGIFLASGSLVADTDLWFPFAALESLRALATLLSLIWSSHFLAGCEMWVGTVPRFNEGAFRGRLGDARIGTGCIALERSGCGCLHGDGIQG